MSARFYPEICAISTDMTITDACYTPASFATAEALQTKVEKYDQRLGTVSVLVSSLKSCIRTDIRQTHWPHDNFYSQEPKLRLGKVDSQERDRPFEEPEETDMILKLAGKLVY